MDINVNTTYKVTFDVVYREGTEGGMRSGSFGKTVNTVAEAILLLEVAQASQAGDRSDQREWEIVMSVAKVVKQEKVK